MRRWKFEEYVGGLVVVSLIVREPVLNVEAEAG